MRLTVLVLTKNEERHIERCLASVASFATRCIVVDSGSTDRTVELAQAAGAEVLFNPWINYATQMNWAIDQVGPEADWVLRLDADEVVTPELADEIQKVLASLPSEVAGVYVSRRMKFLNRPIRWGGVFPVRVLRLFRNGRGRCEARWMDEHISVKGSTFEFDGEIVDDNLNSLTWWTEKHNGYSSREVIDLLNLEHRFLPFETISNLRDGNQAGMKRWLKENIYASLPIGLRALVYFIYRFVFRLGFLDGREGAAFHILQGFWYRYLVDAKLFEVRCYMKSNEVDAVTAIQDVLKIDAIAPYSSDDSSYTSNPN